MAEPARRQKINKRYEGAPCTWCGDALALGAAGVVCEACESPHHERCWDEHNGCGSTQCVNAPLAVLPELETKAKEKPLRPGETRCPNCGDVVTGDFCLRCNLPTTGGAGMPAATMPPEVKNAITYAIVGLFCIGFYFGYKAFQSGREAKERIARDPRLYGSGLATFAQILGVFDIVAWVFAFFVRLAQL